MYYAATRSKRKHGDLSCLDFRVLACKQESSFSTGLHITNPFATSTLINEGRLAGPIRDIDECLGDYYSLRNT